MSNNDTPTLLYQVADMDDMDRLTGKLTQSTTYIQKYSIMACSNFGVLYEYLIIIPIPLQAQNIYQLQHH